MSFECSHSEKPNMTLNLEVGFVALIAINIKIMTFWA
jgi:hypothetical protein